MKSFALLISFGVFLNPLFLNATNFINTEDHPCAIISMKESIMDQPLSKKEETRLVKQERKLNWLETKLRKVTEKRFSNPAYGRGIFSDPVNKWLWLWIIGWGFGILLTIISGASFTSGFLGILWFVAFIGGSVALIIWLLKKFG